MKYEYKFFHRVYLDDMDTKLTSFSEDGWRLYYLALSSGENAYDLVFERVLVEEPQVVNIRLDGRDVGKALNESNSFQEFITRLCIKYSG